MADTGPRTTLAAMQARAESDYHAHQPSSQGVLNVTRMSAALQAVLDMADEMDARALRYYQLGMSATPDVIVAAAENLRATIVAHLRGQPCPSTQDPRGASAPPAGPGPSSASRRAGSGHAQPVGPLH